MKTHLKIFCTCLVVATGCGSNPASSKRVDPPSPPRDLVAEKFSDGEVILRWTLSAGEDVVGYNIYRSEEHDRMFVKADFVAGGHFRDVGLTYSTSYFYRIVAVNSAGLESTPLEIGGTPNNNLWPAMPHQVRVEARNLTMLGYEPEIELTWTANSEADLAHYCIYGSNYRDFEPDESTRLDEVEFPRLIHRQVEEGAVYFFKITAVDVGNLESLAAEASVELMHPPILEQPIRGNVVESKLVFAWQAVPVNRPDIQIRYTVSVAEGPASRELWVADVDGNQTQVTYSGPELEAGTYWWKVLAEVTDTRNTAVSLALSALENFKVR
jgi:hypothetical protein